MSRESFSWRLKPEICKALDKDIFSTHLRTIHFIQCPKCGGDIEIWSDEKVGICLNCSFEWDDR